MSPPTAEVMYLYGSGTRRHIANLHPAYNVLDGERQTLCGFYAFMEPQSYMGPRSAVEALPICATCAKRVLR